MKTLDSIDSGSNYQFGDKIAKPMLPRSMYDLSHLNTMTINNAGELIPICLIRTVPGDSFDINVDTLLRVLPQLVPPYSRQRLYINGFWNRESDLWNRAQLFMTKGYSGNNIISKPILGLNNTPNTFGNVDPESLFDYMGLPINSNASHLFDEGINALPFMMYERIYRDYYMNKNFYIDNRYWLPDDDHDFMLNTDGTINSNLLNDPTGPQLGVKRYRDYPQDYFLSALPFPQRGDTPTLDFSLTLNDILSVGVQDGGNFIPLQAYLFKSDSGAYSSIANASTTLRNTNSFTGINIGAIQSDTIGGTRTTEVRPYIKAQMEDIIAHSTVTLNQLRELSSQQAILEKMARTDGSYQEFGLTFFNRVSKNAMDYRAVYIGGTYQSISFTEVLQSVPTATSPLGAYGGHGITYQNNGYIGHVECDDYGYIMLIASIMPDVYYCQGLDRMFTERLQAEQYLPERARLGMREILNKELIFAGIPEADNDLFAYQTPFDDYRYKASTLHGKIADPLNLSFSPYTQARFLSGTPAYSQELARANNVRKDYLAASNECAYTAQFGINIRAVRPIPYNPMPAQII